MNITDIDEAVDTDATELEIALERYYRLWEITQGFRSKTRILGLSLGVGVAVLIPVLTAILLKNVFNASASLALPVFLIFTIVSFILMLLIFFCSDSLFYWDKWQQYRFYRDQLEPYVKKQAVKMGMDKDSIEIIDGLGVAAPIIITGTIRGEKSTILNAEFGPGFDTPISGKIVGNGSTY